MRYPEKEPLCPHCDGLTDQQVRRIRLRHHNNLAGSANMGRLFLYVAGLFVVGMVIFLLNKG